MNGFIAFREVLRVHYLVYMFMLFLHNITHTNKVNCITVCFFLNQFLSNDQSCNPFVLNLLNISTICHTR